MDYKKIIKAFPLIMALFFVPISMRMIKVDIPFDVQMHWKGTSYEYDIFTYFRSILLIINAVITVGILFFSISSETFVKIKKLKPVLIAFGILVLVSILSAFFGGNSIIAFEGAPLRYEGLYSFIGYYFIFFYAVTTDFDKSIHKIIVGCVAIFTAICAIVGFSQYIGKDIFLTPLGATFYIPSDLKEFRDSMNTTQFSFKTMYLLTSHYNYSSMITSILSAFWVMYLITVPKKSYRILAGIMSTLSLIMLLASNGRSGIVALFITVLVMIIVFFRKIIENKIISIGILAVLVVFIGLGIGFGMMSRFTDLLADIKKIGDTTTQGEDYIRSQIPLKDIKTTENSYTIVYDGFTLTFDKTKGEFLDENNKPIAFTTPSQGNIVFSDPKYVNVSVIASTRNSNEVEGQKNSYHAVRIDGIFYNFDVTDNVKLVNHMGTEIFPEKAQRIGFKGMEKLGSGRGFITASTIPVILKSPIIGHGADSFIQVFNQDDIFTKLYVYGNPNELVDKPHNLYLLYAVNFGLVGLVAFVFMFIYLIIKAKKRYKTKSLSEDAIYIAALAGVISYMGSGFFNDSIVSISPIFWTFFGLAVSKMSEE